MISSLVGFSGFIKYFIILQFFKAMKVFLIYEIKNFFIN